MKSIVFTSRLTSPTWSRGEAGGDVHRSEANKPVQQGLSRQKKKNRSTLLTQMAFNNLAATLWESQEYKVLHPDAATASNWSCRKCDPADLIASAAEGAGNHVMGLYTVASRAGPDRNHYSINSLLL